MFEVHTGVLPVIHYKILFVQTSSRLPTMTAVVTDSLGLFHAAKMAMIGKD